MILVGMDMILLYAMVALTAFQLHGIQIGISQGGVLTHIVGLPVILVGFGLFLLFERMSIASWIVDALARSAFSAYLITDYSALQGILWSGIMDLRAVGSLPSGPLWAFPCRSRCMRHALYST